MRDESNNPSNKSSNQYSNGGANQSTFGQTGSQIMQQTGKNSSLSLSKDQPSVFKDLLMQYAENFNKI
jgi:hypothetical protein